MSFLILPSLIGLIPCLCHLCNYVAVKMLLERKVKQELRHEQRAPPLLGVYLALCLQVLFPSLGLILGPSTRPKEPFGWKGDTTIVASTERDAISSCFLHLDSVLPLLPVLSSGHPTGGAAKVCRKREDRS